MAAMPDLVQIQEQFKDKGVVFLGLTPEPPTELPNVRAVLDALLEMKWPIGYGAGPTLDGLEWDNLLPTYLVYNGAGKLVWSSHSHHGLEDALVKAVEQ